MSKVLILDLSLVGFEVGNIVNGEEFFSMKLDYFFMVCDREK